MPGADAIVMGRGNTVPAGVKGVIIGNGQTLESDGMVVSDLTVTNTINGDAVVPYKRYIANVTQSGSAAPTVSILENTIGDIVWTRTSSGVYQGVLFNAFIDDFKTYLTINQNLQNLGGVNYITWFDGSTIQIDTLDNTFTNSDTLLVYTTIEIRTY
jgi:hypothetical protein